MHSNRILVAAASIRGAPTGDGRVLKDLVGEQRPVMRDQTEVPKLTDLQNLQVVAVIPAN